MTYSNRPNKQTDLFKFTDDDSIATVTNVNNDNDNNNTDNNDLNDTNYYKKT